MMKNIKRPTCRRGSGYTLMEVLVSMTILLAGILAIAGFFPRALDNNTRAADLSIAAFIAQSKAELIRLSNESNQTPSSIDYIAGLSTMTEPVVYGLDERFSYRFSGETFLYANDPTVTTGVARVIIVYTDDPDTPIYELTFDL
jgi:Tfp pilus assembly protein PilV